MNSDDLYHVTLLSNFARAFDKYARVYSKAQIPESRYLDRFFLLSRDELAIGVARTRALLAKTDLVGDRMLVLHTTVSSDDLRPNLRTGLGRYVERADIPVTGLSFVDDDLSLTPVEIEEASAASLRILTPSLQPYETLQPRSVSLLPIARGCQAACSFCFSEASVSADQAVGKVDLARSRAVLEEGHRRGATRAVITGGGEPGLLRFDRLVDLVRVSAQVFPKVVLITNGWFLQEKSDPQRQAAVAELAEAGLSVLTVSVHHQDEGRNAEIMHLQTRPGRIAATWAADCDRWPELRLRWICVLQRGGVDSVGAVADFLDGAAACGVTEVCFKELYVSTSQESLYHSHESNAWSRRHQIPLSVVLEFARAHGWEEIERLPWGSPVFRGLWRGVRMKVAAYTEPSLFWERSHGVCRSWNLMADGRCLASLEDRASEVYPHELSRVPVLA